ncbi:repressor LexA [Clostridioides mangenotii]|jgi:repressor LexA|uniref:LexA repressor n=2 Tax=Metaclostridioides mangenotii TaxID=1540 RepID=A0ABS4E831_9FIRM|nr:repressor LexA [Clostridioides mangenotii]
MSEMIMYLDLTEKQALILEFIKSELVAKGYPPAVREICNAVGLRSTSTVHSHLNKLEKLGYIRKDPTKPRAIEVLDRNKDDNVTGFNQEIINLPLVGEITAGEPILAHQNIQEYIPLPTNLIKGKDNFVLKVKGESMINAGILDGDYVVVDKNSSAENSEIVVALVNGEAATVKRFFKEENFIRLQPENEFMEAIILNDYEVEIIGIVTGVFRVMK